MRLLLFTFVVMIMACNNEQAGIAEPKKIDAYRVWMEANTKRIDSTAVLDSFRFVRYDTVTQRQWVLTAVDNIHDDHRNVLEVMKSDVELMKSYSDIARLYRSLDQSMFVMYRDKALDLEKEVKDLARHRDEGAVIVDSLIKKVYPVADSVTPIAFYAACFYQRRSGDQTVTRDTAYLLVNLNKDIIDRKNFFYQHKAYQK
jgi:hypothetical protein